MEKLKKISRKNRVFEEIQSFSTSEFKAFLAFLGPDRKDRNFKKLIKAMKGLKSIDQLDGLGWDGNALKNACNYILRRIIQFKAEEHKGDKYKFAEIRLSIEMEMLSYARKLLLSAFKKAYASESMGILWELYEIEKHLRSRHGFKVIRNREFMSASEFGRELSLKMKAEGFRDRERENLRENMGKLKDYSETLTPEMEEFEYDFQLVRPQLEALKAIRGWHMLREEGEKVAEKQDLILDLMAKNASLWNDYEIIWERCNFAVYLVVVKRSHAGLKIVQDIGGKLEVSSRTPRKLISQWTAINVIAHACALQVGAGVKMEELVLQNLEIMDAWNRPELFHALSIIYVYEENWEKVLKWQNRVSRSRQSSKSVLSWVPPLLKGIAYLELGDRDNAAAQLEGLKEEARTLNNEFVDLSYVIFAEFVGAEWGDAIPAKRLQEFKQELSRLGGMKRHRRTARFLNISSWIGAREAETSIVEAISRGGIELYFGF